MHESSTLHQIPISSSPQQESPSMDHTKNLMAYVAAVSSTFLAGALCLLILYPSNPFYYDTKVSGDDELGEVLRRAAMPNKAVIIAVVNKAYVQPPSDEKTAMLDLFLESLRVGEDTAPLRDHLLLAAVDQTAYNRCKDEGLHCYRVVTDGIDFGGEEVYMSKDFIKMMWRRTLFLLEVLKHGYNFVFTDADVMWLRNPFLKLSKGGADDLQISVDSFNGDPRSEKNPINTGFYYIISNNKTISLFESWYAQKDNSTGKKEQDVLLDLMWTGKFRELGLRVRFLDTQLFSGFCQDSRDVWAVTTVHANCCRHITAKLQDLEAVLGDWKRFTAAVDGHLGFQWSGHIECLNSWKHK